MSIILRTLKGSALTYDEMDRNLSQYFYSSSVHDSGTELRLHYTGSDNLDTVGEDYGPDRYHSVTLGSGGGGSSLTVTGGGILATNISVLQFTGGVSLSNPSQGTARIEVTGAGGSPGGSNGSIQFNNSSTFGGDSKLFYNSSDYLVGVGINNPSARLHIVGDDKASAIVRLATSGGDADQPRVAKLTFFDGSTQLGEVGKTSADSNNLFLTAVNKLNFKIGLPEDSDPIATVTSTGLGIGRVSPNRPLVVVGTKGIAIQKSAGEGDDSTTPQSILQPIPQTVFDSSVISSSQPRGLFISAPLINKGLSLNGGHVVVSLASDTSTNSFSIIKSSVNGYSSATSVATFRANGRVGIALANGDDPQTALHVNGQIRGGVKLDYTDGDLALGLGFYKVIKKSVATTQTITATNSTSYAGTEATLIIQGDAAISVKEVVTFGTTFKTIGTLSVSANRFYTLKFVSDGTYWYETSRTAAMT